METFTEYSDCNCEDLIIEAAEYKGREVTLNNPIRTSENKNKKFKSNSFNSKQ